MNRKIIILYNWFEHKNILRRNEMLFSLSHICGSVNVDTIIVCTDSNTTPPIQHEKIKHEICSSRPTYREMFNIGNNYVDDNDVQILLNSDCFFDDISLKKISSYMKPNEFWSVSRVELIDYSSYVARMDIDPKGSQDAWCVLGKVPTSIDCDFCMGTPQCDHRILFEFHKSGYTITNHCIDLILYHVHMSQKRNYDINFDRLIGGCVLIQPTIIGDTNPKLYFFDYLGDGKVVYHF